MSDEDFIRNEEEIGLDTQYVNKKTEFAVYVGMIFLIMVGTIAFIFDHIDWIKKIIQLN